MRRLRRLPAPAAGALVLLLAGIVAYLGFHGPLPFRHPYTLHAVFRSASAIRPGAPVRIAGVDVGRVTAVGRYRHTRAARLTMEIDPAGLPVHADARLDIRPRLFLEGNFFVDLAPGSPGAPAEPSGATIPLTRTAAPVQLDQVLDTLDRGARSDLQAALAGYGQGLTDRGGPRGASGAEALNASLDHAPGALKGLAVTSRAALGTRAHDLSGLIAGLDRVGRALDHDEGALQGLLTGLDTTTAAFAERAGAVRAALAALPRTLGTADRALAALRTSFPATRALARELVPGVRALPGTIAAGLPWIAQAQALLAPAELGGVLRDLQPSVAGLARLTRRALSLLPQLRLAASCARDVLLPAGEEKIQDGALTTGAQNYQELLYALVGLAGEGQQFDGNGPYARFGLGTGPSAVTLGGSAADPVFAAPRHRLLGVRPAYHGTPPPFRPRAACRTQPLPDVNGPAAAPAPPDGSGS